MAIQTFLKNSTGKEKIWFYKKSFLILEKFLVCTHQITIETMGLFYENVEKVIVLFLFLIDYNNVGCLEMLGVGGPDWVHRY